MFKWFFFFYRISFLQKRTTLIEHVWLELCFLIRATVLPKLSLCVGICNQFSWIFYAGWMRNSDKFLLKWRNKYLCLFFSIVFLWVYVYPRYLVNWICPISRKLLDSYICTGKLLDWMQDIESFSGLGLTNDDVRKCVENN